MLMRQRLVVAILACVLGLPVIMDSGAHGQATKKKTKAPSLDPITSGDPNKLMHDGTYCSWIHFLADGNTLMTVAGDKIVRVWDFGKRMQTSAFALVDASPITISKDGSKVATADKKDIRVIDNTGKEIAQLGGHTIGVAGMSFSADGKYLVTTDRHKTNSSQPQGITKVWEFPGGKEIASIAMAGSTSVAMSPDGKTIAMVVEHKVTDPTTKLTRTGGALSILGLDGKERHHELTNHQIIRNTAFSTDGKLYLTACLLGNVNLWDVQTGKAVHAIKNKAFDYIESVAISPDGKLFAVGGSGGKVSVYDTKSGKVLHELVAHSKEIRHLAISGDNKWLVAGGGSDRAISVTAVPTK